MFWLTDLDRTSNQVFFIYCRALFDGGWPVNSQEAKHKLAMAWNLQHPWQSLVSRFIKRRKRGIQCLSLTFTIMNPTPPLSAPLWTCSTNFLVHNDNVKIANIFNTYFASIFTHDSDTDFRTTASNWLENLLYVIPTLAKQNSLAAELSTEVTN